MENWLLLPAEPGYEEHGWEYDADSIFVDSATGYIVVTIMDDMFFMLGADAIDCVNRVEYRSVLPGLDDEYDPDWRSKPHSIGPSDYVYGFANQYCPIRGSLRVGTLQ